MWIWLVAVFGASAALMALAEVRRLRLRLEDLRQSYWELRYDYTRLRAQVGRLDRDRPPDGQAEPTPASVSFVPLAALKPGPPTS